MNKEDPTQGILVWSQPFTVTLEDLEAHVLAHSSKRENSDSEGDASKVVRKLQWNARCCVLICVSFNTLSQGEDQHIRSLRAKTNWVTTHDQRKTKTPRDNRRGRKKSSAQGKANLIP